MRRIIVTARSIVAVALIVRIATGLVAGGTSKRMETWLRIYDPVTQAFLAGLFTLGITALGASLVVFGRKLPDYILDVMLGFAAGVMISASFWSLLIPAVSLSEGLGIPGWAPATIGFLAGSGFLMLIDRTLPHLHFGLPMEKAEGMQTAWQRATLLVLAITLHNIPEGLAVGVAFGAASLGGMAEHGATLTAAIALAIGIGIQNFPEGIAVSMPLRAAGMTRWKSFWYGVVSAAVEPVAAVIGAMAVMSVKPILPYALAFAAGAMIFVVVEELIPESQQGGRGDLATMATLVGFTAMMILDVALG